MGDNGPIFNAHAGKVALEEIVQLHFDPAFRRRVPTFGLPRIRRHSPKSNGVKERVHHDNRLGREAS
jgi:hypothetical protein